MKPGTDKANAVRSAAGRREDHRFLTGNGRYTGDIRPEGCLYARFVRSEHAHTWIIGIDFESALAVPGVLAVFGANDLGAAGVTPEPGRTGYPRADGSPGPKTDRPALASEFARYLGEPLAVVIAETEQAAADGAEAVVVDIEPLAAVTTAPLAMANGAPAVWHGAPDNVGYAWQGGDIAAADAALATAAHVTRLSCRVSRVSACPLEPRAFLAWIEADGRLGMTASHQSPHSLRAGLINRGVDDDPHVTIGDVGGSFGMKGGLHGERAVVAFAAKKLGRPVLWESDRSEAMLSDPGCREAEAEIAIGFDAGARIVGLTGHVDLNIGAYLSGASGSSVNNIGSMAGVYDIPVVGAHVRGILTHTPPIAAYRGAGRPEAAYYIERTIDLAAREMGLDPIELRRRNFVLPEQMPFKTALTFTYDCGDFPALLERGTAEADIAGFPARRAEAAKSGRLLGLGVATCIETSGGSYKGPAPDFAQVSLLPDGRLVIDPGSFSVGQGHETSFPRLVAERFGTDKDQVLHRQSDTDWLEHGRGNGGSGSTSVGGPAIDNAAENLVAILTDLAAARLGLTTAELVLEDGVFRQIDGNRSLSLAELAEGLPIDPDGSVAVAKGTFKPPAPSFPNGLHVAEVEVDPETGERGLTRYTAVEDLGRVLNPELVEGQIHGGVTQGAGQALGEELIYDPNGQLLTGSFMDYAMPRAGDMPDFHFATSNVPTSVNPLGVKGVGEAGTVGGLCSVMNAVNDALWALGVRHIDMPATPMRIWAAIRDAHAKVDGSGARASR